MTWVGYYQANSWNSDLIVLGVYIGKLRKNSIKKTVKNSTALTNKGRDTKEYVSSDKPVQKFWGTIYTLAPFLRSESMSKKTHSQYF